MAVGNTVGDMSGDFKILLVDSLGRQIMVGQVAEDAAVSGDGPPILIAGRYDASPRSVDDGDKVTLALTAAGGVLVQATGQAAEDAAVAGNPVLIAGRYDATPRTLDDGDVGAIALDAAGRPNIVGAIAEDAAAAGNPILTGGRYDSTPRDIDDGDVGAIALDLAGNVLTARSGINISQSPTVTAGIYAANDAVGGLLTFANAARVTGRGGSIKSTLILDDAGQDAETELWLFNATFTAMADNDPWAPSEADLRKLVAIISTAGGAWFAAGTPSAARVEVSQRYDLTGTSLFGQLVTRGTPTYAATDDVTVILGLETD